MKAISHILDHSYSLLDSPRANQSFPKAAKSLTKEQEEDKVSKKGNNKAKQTSKKLPHCRPEDRSKQKSCSVTPKKSKVVSPSTSLALSSNNTTVITKTITRTFPLKQKMHLVNVKAQHLQNINKQSESIKDLEIQMLQVECEELKNQLGCLREGLMGLKPGDMEELLKQSQKELLWLQRQLSFISAGGSVCVLAASKFGNDPSCLQPATSQKTFDQVQFLEERQISKSDVTTLNQEYHHWQFLKNELKDDVQETNRLSLQYASVSHKALQYDQVKSDYDHLRETLIRVTKERDLAVKGKHQLQAKLENLEQVLKHMREAAERRQQLELEHEQALAVLNAKQQEIELLQKAKVRELEEKCRTQSEQFNLLSRELEKFRQQAGKIDLLSSNTVASSDIPGSPSKSLSQLVNGIATSIGKGHESPSGSRCVISEFIRPLQISGDKPEQLSVKPTFLSKSRSGAPRCRFDSDMDNDQNSNTSKQRYSGKVHLCIARYSYNPFDGPNENPEAELPLTAGKYLYVYGDMDEDGFYEGELLDGQRGLVPSNFVDFVQDNETRLSSTLSSEQDQNFINHSGSTLEGDILEISPPSHIDSSIISNGAGTLDVNIDEIGEDIVPYPRKITLIKQLAKSVIVGWEPPVVPPGWGTISSYNVLVDKEVRMNIALGSRTKALIEKLNISTCTYRISVQSITNKGNSDELQCSLLVGKDVIVAPSNLKVDNITQISAELSWLPTNSNYSHVIFLNEEEFDIVKAASYKYHFFNLKPNMAYKVKVMAKPHQMPWQLPLEQREKKEAFVEFSTLPAGPPAPPQDVTVRAGSTPATVQVSWKPPTLTATGTSHGANVTGYGVYVKGQRVAEVIFPTAENTLVELMRLRNLEAKEVTVRTLSAQGESVDSTVAAIPSDLLVPPTPHPRTAPKSKPLASAGAPETKEEHLDPHLKMDESWEQTRSASPVHGHTLEPPLPNFHSPLQGRRSPSPNRILPQPQGTPVPNTVAKAMAREAAQRVAESNRMERRSVFSERSNAAQYANSDDEEDGYDSPNVKRRGASVDDFLKGSELGKQPHYCHGEEYHTESSRGSDLSDIMEEDEEELYSEMQLEDGGRRRVSVTSHNALKECDKNKTTEATFLEQPDFSQQIHHSKKLFSIPEVAEEDGEYSELLYKQGLGMPYKKNPTIARDSRPPRPYNQDQQHNFWYAAKHRISGMEDFAGDDKGCKYSRSLSRSPDSGLDCGSEEEESRFTFRYGCDSVSANVASICCAETANCSCRKSMRPLLARRKTLTRQTSIEEDFGDLGPSFEEPRNEQVKPSYEKKYEAQRCNRTDNLSNEEVEGGWKTDLKMADSRAAGPLAKPSHRDAEDSLLLGNPSSAGRPERAEHAGRRSSHGSAVPQRSRPMLVPSIEITMDSNSEGGWSRSGSEGNISPVKEEAYYRSIGGHKKWPQQRTMASEYRYDGYGGHDHLSPDFYEESETDPGTEDISTRIFVALFDYDPLTMSPNPDAAEEELPFKEGQIIKVYGDKDADGFYRGETCTRIGLIPCNMVSEIQADDEEMMDQLLKQGFLPLNTPVEKIVNCDRFKESTRSVHRRSRKSKRERNRRSGRQPSVSTRRMVALYDYDPRESSPNVDVEAELTFCTGDIITVFGEIDEDGFYYGELNGQKGLVPSNFLEEVPDDVEVYLSDAPSQYLHDTPMRTKAKRVPPENTGTARRAPSPTVHLHSGSPTSSMGSGSPGRGRDMSSKKKKGLLSKGKKLLKKLGAVK
ncbi:RIMS-binding protein 2 isoform X4 [Anas platyrhynchos]|uniref:RIMS-binding protein 2 isoform X4 n=1 Tax=Anas platyrhynchos TaxID=8839 RepID=UPI000A3B53F5|nr:RIMS-binding protein 2 isoform X4 [Anas platyrhynchos]|eukprot:XP_021127032.1 RIMS-binding protein 2 isoform X3 [Anas platyrhynchos]